MPQSERVYAPLWRVTVLRIVGEAVAGTEDMDAPERKTREIVGNTIVES